MNANNIIGKQGSRYFGYNLDTVMRSLKANKTLSNLNDYAPKNKKVVPRKVQPDSPLMIQLKRLGITDPTQLAVVFNDHKKYKTESDKKKTTDQKSIELLEMDNQSLKAQLVAKEKTISKINTNLIARTNRYKNKMKSEIIRENAMKAGGLSPNIFLKDQSILDRIQIDDITEKPIFLNTKGEKMNVTGEQFFNIMREKEPEYEPYFNTHYASGTPAAGGFRGGKGNGKESTARESIMAGLEARAK